MSKEKARLTLIGGPTILIEFAGVRLLTDPTFDEAQVYSLPDETLEKLTRPAIPAESLLPIDAVLLSHDQHIDNLDRAGRAFLAKAQRVISTTGAAQRLGGNCEGLTVWSSTSIETGNGSRTSISATPARHGPRGIEPVTGDVIGFAVSVEDAPAIYVSGDTVWFEGIAEIAKRFDVGLAVLFAGSAQPRGPFNVTMNSNDAIEAAAAFKDARIVAVHNQGWSHYVQSQEDLVKAFEVVGINRLHLLEPGIPVEFRL